MSEADLYCVACGKYCGEGSHICPECRADAAKLAGYICSEQAKRERAAEKDYDHYIADQAARRLHRFCRKKRR